MKLRTAALVCASILCFSGNSLICKAALGPGLIGPSEFTLVRMLAGALVLGVIARFRGRGSARSVTPASSALALFAYAAFFSLAYVRLDAGIGALVLFGSVQATILFWKLREGEPLSAGAGFGLAIALAGLTLLTLPGKDAPDLIGVFLMAAAGGGWGAYTLKGRVAADPLATTATNFLRAVPLALLFFAAVGATRPHASGPGLALAALSGAVTSGLGYAIWYSVVPSLGTLRAGVVQLAVPPATLAAAVLLLGERFTPRAIAAALLILLGIATVLKAGGRRTHLTPLGPREKVAP